MQNALLDYTSHQGVQILYSVQSVVLEHFCQKKVYRVSSEMNSLADDVDFKMYVTLCVCECGGVCCIKLFLQKCFFFLFDTYCDSI